MAKDDDDKKDEAEKDTTAAEEAAASSDDGDSDVAKSAAANGNGAANQDGDSDDDDSDDDDSDDDDSDDDDSDEDEDEDEDEEEEAPEAEAKSESVPPKKIDGGSRAPAPAAAHATAHDDHGFGHLISVKLLGAVLASLLVLTYVTFAVSKIDLGAQWNLLVAMVIATIKAGLVVTFFMHMLWDKKFNLLVFLSSVLFLILFLSFTLTDRREYQNLIDQREAAAAQTAVQ
jgi:cytochrome c oxidase subunit IV